MYGVDQCRVCGKPITVPSKKARAEQEKTNRKPPIPEAEWRRRGFSWASTRRTAVASYAAFSNSGNSANLSFASAQGLQSCLAYSRA
jgi:hypothetical protein